MKKTRLNKKEAERYFRQRWQKFLAYERSEYDCISLNDDFPFLYNDQGSEEVFLIFRPHNIEDYLKLRISKALYIRLKEAGILDRTVGMGVNATTVTGIRRLIEMIKVIPPAVATSWKRAWAYARAEERLYNALIEKKKRRKRS